jgi:hypothetical protein
LFNFYKNPQKFREVGEVYRKLANLWHEKDVVQYYTDLIRMCVGKSEQQAYYEFLVTRNFVENFAGDNRKSFN